MAPIGGVGWETLAWAAHSDTKLETVEPVTLATLTGLIGLAMGVAAMLAFRSSERSRVAGIDIDEPTLPEGTAEVLSVIGRAYLVVDTVDGVVRANPAAYAYGLVRGHTVVHKEILGMTAQVRRDGVIQEREYELSRGPLNQGSMVLQLRVAPVGDEYILILADDRTELVRSEAIRTDFVANVSHELKTPVGAISLLAEALQDASDDPVAVERFASRTQKEANRLAALVQDIIELSRLQGADVIQQGEDVDLDSVIAEAIDRNKLPAENKNIKVVSGGKASGRVYGDRDLLMTAFRNLIDNAIRYSAEGTRIGIGVKVRDGVVAVTVTDQGPGINPEEQDRIFERFYRVDSARSRHTGGTGLGLSIVKHVITNHGGEISVWSQAGQGSTFTVRLPLVETEAEQVRVRNKETGEYDGAVEPERHPLTSEIPILDPRSAAKDKPTKN